MNYTKLRIKKNLINRECLIKKPYSFWSENKSFQEIITTQKMINQTDKAAENSSNVISESPSVLKRSNIAFASSEGRFLSMTSTSLLNSSRLSLPSLLLSKIEIMVFNNSLKFSDKLFCFFRRRIELAILILDTIG